MCPENNEPIDGLDELTEPGSSDPGKTGAASTEPAPSTGTAAETETRLSEVNEKLGALTEQMTRLSAAMYQPDHARRMAATQPPATPPAATEADPDFEMMGPRDLAQHFQKQIADVKKTARQEAARMGAAVYQRSKEERNIERQRDAEIAVVRSADPDLFDQMNTSELLRRVAAELEMKQPGRPPTLQEVFDAAKPRHMAYLREAASTVKAKRAAEDAADSERPGVGGSPQDLSQVKIETPKQAAQIAYDKMRDELEEPEESGGIDIY